MMETVQIIFPKTMHMAETGFIDAIRDHLNWNAVKTAVKQHFDVDVHENVKYIKGALVVCQGEVSVRFDFDLEIKFSLFINCDGRLMRITAPERQSLNMEDKPEISAEPYLDEKSRTEATEIAAEIALMLQEING